MGFFCQETKQHSQLEQKHWKESSDNPAFEPMIGMALGMITCILLKDLAESLSSTTVAAKSGTYAFLHWTYSGSVTPMNLKSVQPCLEEHSNYCINGNCVFHTKLKMPTCRCLVGYSGERCENIMLSSYTQYTYEGYIAVGIGAAMLLTGIFAIIYCYIRKRYKYSECSHKAHHEETSL